ncbi:MAG: hypothetical protein H7263_03245 [Candidatus Sericytochromatia bacterium]|nr:hypothetical protein [Candidatus Sericytochromatia bacterium]
MEINENLGVKITLLCLATNCLKRLERIRGLIRTLENMTWEEMYYWYSKCRGKTKNKGLKAFRILLDLKMKLQMYQMKTDKTFKIKICLLSVLSASSVVKLLK